MIGQAAPGKLEGSPFVDIRRGGVFDNAQKWKAPDAAPALSIGREIMRKGKKKRKILTFVCGGGEKDEGVV